MWCRGIRVRVSPSVLLLLAVFIWFSPSVCLAAVLLAAASHELGHYVALRLCGGELAEISVSAFGARMLIRNGERLSYGREALCILAGPLTNGTMSWLLSMAGRWREELYVFAGVQLVLGLFNLLPLEALDGGRLLWIAVACLTDPFAADKVCWAVTVTVLAALTALGVCLWLRHGSFFLLVSTVGLFCCIRREFALANPWRTG